MSPKLEIGDKVTVGRNPTVGEIIGFNGNAVGVRRPHPNGINQMTHWVRRENVRRAAPTQPSGEQAPASDPASMYVKMMSLAEYRALMADHDRLEKRQDDFLSSIADALGFTYDPHQHDVAHLLAAIEGLRNGYKVAEEKAADLESDFAYLSDYLAAGCRDEDCDDVNVKTDAGFAFWEHVGKYRSDAIFGNYVHEEIEAAKGFGRLWKALAKEYRKMLKIALGTDALPILPIGSVEPDATPEIRREWLRGWAGNVVVNVPRRSLKNTIADVFAELDRLNQQLAMTRSELKLAQTQDAVYRRALEWLEEKLRPDWQADDASIYQLRKPLHDAIKEALNAGAPGAFLRHYNDLKIERNKAVKLLHDVDQCAPESGHTSFRLDWPLLDDVVQAIRAALGGK